MRMIRRSRTLLLALCALAACSTHATRASYPPPETLPGPQPAGWPRTEQGPADDAGTADMVLVGGRVFLADTANTVVQAVAIRDGRILAAGTELEGRAFAPTQVERTETDWAHCRVEEGFFRGWGGPHNLAELISIFLDWARSSS